MQQEQQREQRASVFVLKAIKYNIIYEPNSITYY